MQVQMRTFRTVVAVLIASLILGACSGGSGSGSTMFNLPSVPVTVDENGNGKALGFPVGYVGLQPALIAQLQQANVQQLEIRIGYHGIFIYANGQALPYIQWNDESVALLQDVLSKTAGAERAATALPWLRRIGVGVRLKLPLAAGATALEIPRWKGEELVTTETPAATTIGPIQFGGLAYDAAGNPSLEGVALSEIEQSLGASLGLNLPPMVMQILTAVNAQQLTVATQPNGIDLSIDGKPLPGIAYDTARLNSILPIIGPLAGPAMADTLATVIPQLPGADIDLIVSFTGQPASDTKLSSIPIKVNEDGTLSAWGIPLGSSPILTPDVLGKLQAADIQKVDLNIVGDSLYLAANQQSLPVISWSDASLDTFGGVATELFGVSPGLLGSGLAIVRSIVAKTAIGMSLDLPVAAGAAAMSFDAAYDVTASNFAPAASGGGKPSLQTGLVFNDGNLVSAGGIPVETLDSLGVAGISLPANVVSLLESIGAGKISLTTTGNTLELQADGNPLVGVEFDNAALDLALGIAGNFVSDPAQLEMVGAALPEILASDVNLEVTLDGQPAAATKLTSLPLAVNEDGSLTAFGFAVGGEPILQPQFIADMQAINVQRLDANIVGDSLYLATNGQNLPVLSWNDKSLDIVQNVLSSLLGLSPDLLDTGLAFLKDSDVGLALSLPAAAGTEPVSIPDDFDVTAVQMEAPQLGDLVMPSLQLGLVLNGTEIESIGNIPADTLRSLGIVLPSLPANVVEILGSLGSDQLTLNTTSNALELAAGGESLLKLGYDSPTMQRLLTLAGPFLSANLSSTLADPAVAQLVSEQLLPMIIAANLSLVAEVK
ncbi:MAG: hypothetical protein DWI57_03155 [Chloroflexi bacterium]|nr:MAG: hypothetical protein DWI57_03155 [Chloroflexota bacterium]